MNLDKFEKTINEAFEIKVVNHGVDKVSTGRRQKGKQVEFEQTRKKVQNQIKNIGNGFINY